MKVKSTIVRTGSWCSKVGTHRVVFFGGEEVVSRRFEMLGEEVCAELPTEKRGIYILSSTVVEYETETVFHPFRWSPMAVCRQ